MENKKERIIEQAPEEVLIEDMQSGRKIFIASTKYDVAQLLGLGRDAFKKCFPKRNGRRSYI